MAVLDVTALRDALEASGVSAELIPETIKRVTHPPLSLHISTSDDPFELAFDRDDAARMLYLEERKPDPAVRWTMLSPAERKRAKRLWDWAVGPDGLNVVPQGRPPVVDTALVIYCTRVICEASGRPKFRTSRPPDGGAPGGPMWRALTEALPLAMSHFRRLRGEPAITSSDILRHAETILETVKVIGSKRFKDLCEKFGLGVSAADVASDNTGPVESFFREGGATAADVACLRIRSIGQAAKLTVRSAGNGCPVFAWKHSAEGARAPPVRKNMPRVVPPGVSDSDAK